MPALQYLNPDSVHYIYLHNQTQKQIFLIQHFFCWQIVYHRNASRYCDMYLFETWGIWTPSAKPVSFSLLCKETPLTMKLSSAILKHIPVGFQPFEMIHSVETSFMKVPCWPWTSARTEALFICGRAAFSRFSFTTWPLSNTHTASCVLRSILRSLFYSGSESLILRLGQITRVSSVVVMK